MPLPGISVFQSRSASPSHCTGGVASAEMPVPSPRQAGQDPARADIAKTMPTRSTRTRSSRHLRRVPGSTGEARFPASPSLILTRVTESPLGAIQNQSSRRRPFSASGLGACGAWDLVSCAQAVSSAFRAPGPATLPVAAGTDSSKPLGRRAGRRRRGCRIPGRRWCFLGGSPGQWPRGGSGGRGGDS